MIIILGSFYVGSSILDRKDRWRGPIRPFSSYVERGSCRFGDLHQNSS